MYGWRDNKVLNLPWKWGVRPLLVTPPDIKKCILPPIEQNPKIQIPPF